MALLSRSAKALQAVAATVASPSLIVVADIVDAGALEKAVLDVVEHFGRLDAVVHTAQVMAYGLIEDVPREVFERVVEVAMHGTANLARTVLPIFRAQGHGTLVIVNSLLGQIATPRMGSYDSAKWGQLGLARVLQLEVQNLAEVNVCIVSPGAVDTPIYDQAANYAGRPSVPPPPVVSPERVAEAIHRCLERPRRHVQVGPANRLTVLGFRLLPAVFDRIVGPLVQALAFRGSPIPPREGNVRTPAPQRERQYGGWTALGRRRVPETIGEPPPDQP